MTDVPPGWYPDPWGMGALRWWDGSRWSPFASPAGAPHPHLGRPSAAEMASARRTEQRTWKWARAVVLAFGVVFMAELVAGILLAGRWTRDMHRFLHDLQTSPPGQAPVFPGGAFRGFYTATLMLDGGELLILAMAVVFLVWQYSAARVARGLGYPARTSPGFGIASWFIPVVNLWFPYWALTDCLPPQHPMRPRALPAWVAFVVSTWLVPGAYLTAFFSTTGAAVVLGLAAVSLCVAVGLGWQLVAAINDAHQRTGGQAA